MAVTPQRIAATLATLGAAAIAAGVALLHPAAGLIAGGTEAICGAYLIAYFGRAR